MAPMIDTNSRNSIVQYESVNSYITSVQISYCKQRGLSQEDILRLIINGYAHDIFKHLPLDVLSEIIKLLFIKL